MFASWTRKCRLQQDMLNQNTYYWQKDFKRRLRRCQISRYDENRVEFSSVCSQTAKNAKSAQTISIISGRPYFYAWQHCWTHQVPVVDTRNHPRVNRFCISVFEKLHPSKNDMHLTSSHKLVAINRDIQSWESYRETSVWNRCPQAELAAELVHHWG